MRYFFKQVIKKCWLVLGHVTIMLAIRVSPFFLLVPQPTYLFFCLCNVMQSTQIYLEKWAKWSGCIDFCSFLFKSVLYVFRPNDGVSWNRIPVFILGNTTRNVSRNKRWIHLLYMVRLLLYLLYCWQIWQIWISNPQAQSNESLKHQTGSRTKPIHFKSLSLWSLWVYTTQFS